MLKMSGPRMWLYVRCKSSPAQICRPAVARDGGGAKNDREVVTCRMNRTLYRWTGEARVKQENLGEKVAVHPACHDGESVA